MSGGFFVHKTGGPEAMLWSERTLGAPGPGELLVRNRAIGLNFIDVYQRAGLYPLPLPFVPGNEGAGEVTAIGPGVTDFAVGDRVGYTGPVGAYAEERLMPAGKAFPIPDGIDYETAAGVMLKGNTAYYLLFLTWPLKAGETILVHAAAGGVGQLLCQWASAIGARVIGTAGSAKKLEIAKASGCSDVINYQTEDFAEGVKELTGGRGVDVVYDGVGKATFERSLDCLRPRGLMVSFGNASGVVSIPDLGILARKGSLYVTRPTTASYFSTSEEMRAAAKATFDAVLIGTIKVGINHRFALKNAPEAHRALEARETSGSVILLP